MSDIKVRRRSKSRDKKRTKASFRRAAFSAATIDDFVAQDTIFMDKISKALKTIHENYGYKGVQDCMSTNEETGDATVDLSVLWAMLDRSQSKLKSECCAMFFASKSIIGSFSYLIGSLLFGAVAYFQNILSPEMRAFMSILGTSFYLVGGILFIFAAIEPYWTKTLEIKRMTDEVYDLKERGEIVKKMGGKRDSDNFINTRMSKLSIDTKAMLAPTMEEEEHQSSSSDIFSSVADSTKSVSPQSTSRLKQRGSLVGSMDDIDGIALVVDAN